LKKEGHLSLGSWARSFKTQSCLQFQYTALTLPEAKYQGKLALKLLHTKSLRLSHKHTLNLSMHFYPAQSKTANRTEKTKLKTDLLHSSCPCCPVHCQNLKNRQSKTHSHEYK